MPLIHIRALPFDPPADVPVLIDAIGRDFARVTGMDLSHVTVTWQTLAAHHHWAGGVTGACQQAEGGPPVLIDLLTPDFLGRERVEAMLAAVADAVSRHAGVALSRLFICHFVARSGGVFDAGEIVRWPGSEA